MNRLALIFCFMHLFFMAKTQDSKHIIGKWQVSAVNDGVYYDYKTGTSTVTAKLTDSLRGKKDSAEIVEMLTSFASQYTNYYFIFTESGKYQEIRNGEIRLEGIYTITNPGKIELKLKRGNQERFITYSFTFLKENLQLLIPGQFNKEELEITLHKSD